ncbi:MAG: hypothetical protein LLF97_10395 [Planctomycetaceae bacterium]|nr:hypothetical protein [Planctomycetaceae bacterium]
MRIAIIFSLANVIGLGYGILALADQQSPKALNNLVTELVHLENVPSGREIAFTLPRESWVYAAVTAASDVTASFVSPDKMVSETMVFCRNASNRSSESMKYLPPGDYKLRLVVSPQESARLVVVRTIPEIFYDGYHRPSQLRLCNAAARNWRFLEKYVNPNINTFVVYRGGRKSTPAADKPTDEVFKEWRRRGKHWVDEVAIDVAAKTVDQTCQYYLSDQGLANSAYHGFLIDEFTRNSALSEEVNRINLEALARIAGRPEFTDKKIHLYVTTPSAKLNEYPEICKFAIDHHSLLSWEWYVVERSPRTDLKTLRDVWNFFSPNWHAGHARQWESFHPGASDSILATLAGWNLPDCCGDVDAELDYKVLLDWQMNFLVNHPVYRNLRGINVWATSYMDEELIRWMCRLYRHYCIDGNRRLLSTDPYVLTHLVNPDFDEGMEGWNIQMAGAETVRAEQFKDFGKIEGRRRSGKGDHFLVTRRSSKGPNTISQTVSNLTPGRLYTFRMYTADYEDLKTGKSKKQTHAVSISLAGATPVPNKELHIPYNCRASAKVKPFDSKNLCWLNFHWLLFKAQGTTAQLTVSDWVDPKHPGGDPDQELTFNFFQIEPYFELTRGAVP